jgi:hypothetical protein
VRAAVLFLKFGTNRLFWCETALFVCFKKRRVLIFRFGRFTIRGQVQYMQESFKLQGYSRKTTVSRDSHADLGRTLSSGSVSCRASTRRDETSLVRRSASAGSGGEIEAERVFVGQLPANCTAAMLRSSFSRWLHVDFALWHRAIWL